MIAHKLPVSVLVVIYTADGQVLLMERADAPGLWQSVTGSQDAGETLEQTAIREVREETGLDASRFELTPWDIENRYEIYERWRHRYAPGVTHNTEHVFGLRLPRAGAGQPGAARTPAIRVAAAGRGRGTLFFAQQRSGHSPAAHTLIMNR